MSSVKENIKNALDAVYGNTNLPERPGYAHGIYEYDVSSYMVACVFAREWETFSVEDFNRRNERKKTDYHGELLYIDNATPFEAWVTEMCDFLQGYELLTYKTSHPLSVINWPTLDPLVHPSEADKKQELLLQGLKVESIEGYFTLQEDAETLDITKIKAKKGAGFFAVYHTYPYYPDFMNYDYPESVNPYLDYLKELKKYHGDQPVLIAEFGVPSSREITHWQRNGWHHGGHRESEQGEIDGLLMQSIYEAKMAGGILFGWFDEWFKKNWMFAQYYIPPERKPFWFNMQDAEENYGLVAAYPNYPEKKVSLSGEKEDWKQATVLYEKEDNAVPVTFNDGYDSSRSFARLLAQHDEGFLYIRVETKGPIDFLPAHYMIGLDTGYSGVGEFLLPFNTNVMSPVGLKFLIHLAGRDKSRVLVCQNYDKYINMRKGEIKPGKSLQGAWVIMQNRTNNRRFSKDGKRVYRSHIYSMSNLIFGSLGKNNPWYDSRADFYYTANTVELRIPWALMNITDPSSKTVLWSDKNNETKKTDGIKIIACSYKPEEGYLFAKSTGLKSNITDCFPVNLNTENVKMYSWDDWDIPLYHMYMKDSYYKYKEALSMIKVKE